MKRVLFGQLNWSWCLSHPHQLLSYGGREEETQADTHCGRDGKGRTKYFCLTFTYDYSFTLSLPQKLIIPHTPLIVFC